LVAVLACSPHKRKFDTIMAAGCQCLFICIFIGGMMVKLWEDIANDTVGSPELAYRFLGLHSSEEAVVIMLVVAFAMLLLIILTLFGEVFEIRVQRRVESQWSVATIDPPRVRWKPRGVYACFLSHYKMEAASDARYIHDMLRKMLQVPVFLDSSALKDLRNLINEGVNNSDSLVLLATKSVLTRPWCLLELLETKRNGIPVVIVQMANSGFTFERSRNFVENFVDEMRKLNRTGLDFLIDRIGPDIMEVKEAVNIALDANESAPLIFDPHAGDHAMLAAMKDVVERLARATGRKIKWKGGDATVPMIWRSSSILLKKVRKKEMISSIVQDLKAIEITGALKSLEGMCSTGARKNSATGGGSRNGSASAGTSGGTGKASWTQGIFKGPRGDLDQDVVNEESAVFVCCSRRDAVRHARVLRAGLSMKLGRGCAIGGGEDAAKFVVGSELMVVLLTKKLLFDPCCLFEMWLAAQRSLTIVTVAISGSGYDYEDASAALADLSTALDHARSGAAQELQEKLPRGFFVDDVGNVLQNSLTSIIALSWSTASKNQLDAVVTDIIASVPKKKAAGSTQSWHALRRSHVSGLARGSSTLSPATHSKADLFARSSGDLPEVDQTSNQTSRSPSEVIATSCRGLGGSCDEIRPLGT